MKVNKCGGHKEGGKGRIFLQGPRFGLASRVRSVGNIVDI